MVITTARFDQMIEFYGSGLGLESFYSDATSCFFKAGGANVVLVRLGADPAEPVERVCLDFSVASVADSAERLRQAGLEIESEREEIVQIRDPDGNLIEFVHG